MPYRISYRNDKSNNGTLLKTIYIIKKERLIISTVYYPAVFHVAEEIVLLIEFNSIMFAKKYKNKAIKKTLTIPEWLNEEAVKANIIFSQVLQEALIMKLHL